MGHIIAMAGKGGTGKTTVASLIARIIKEKKLGSVLAVDADPNSNLAEALGVECKETIGSILDDISTNPEIVPVGMGKDAYIEFRVQTAIVEGEGVDILTMGRPEGPGCYCYVNNALRNSIGKLIKDYDFVIIDNEAGLEHLSRRTTRSADALVVVSDATAVGLKAAKRIKELAKELKIKIKKEFLVVNSAAGVVDQDKIKDINLEFLGVLPFDKKIEKLSLSGKSLFELESNAPSFESLKKLGEKIWQRN